MIAVWLILGASIGLAVASLIHAAKMGKMRARFERVAEIVAERVMLEIGPRQAEQDAQVRRLASALGWASDLETLDRFVARTPENKKTPAYLTPSGACVGDLFAACMAWQIAAPDTLKAAQAAHAETAAAMTREQIQ